MIGRTISNFHITERLGEGGMGTVYKATDRNLHRTVAIKMLHPNLTRQEDSFKRFQNEAHLSARISHPNVATLLDFQEAQDVHFIVMEYVEGLSLEQILRKWGQLPEKEAVKITLQVLEGLSAAHELGITHRDLKPGNVMLDRKGFVKLMDFGIARLENAARLTRNNRVIGTLEYLAPELIKGSTPGKSTDLYAVGITLFEMIAGQMPFKGDSEATLMYQITHGQPNLKALSCQPKLKQVIRKLIHKNPARRYQDTQEVIRDLERSYVPGKIDTQLLQNPTASGAVPALPVQAMGEAIHQVKLPRIELQSIQKNISQVKIPFDMDIRIVGAAVGLCLLILLVGMFKPRTTQPKMPEPEVVEVPSTGAEPSASSQAIPSSLPQSSQGKIPPYVPPKEPIEKQEEKPKSHDQPQDPKEGPKQHVIKPLAEAQAPAQQEEEQAEEDKSSDTEKPSDNRQASKQEAVSEEKSNQESSGDPSSVSASSAKPLYLTFPNLEISVVLSETVSTDTHVQGQDVYFYTTKPTYYGKDLIIPGKARVRANIEKLKSGKNGRKAFLALKLKAVEAAGGNWIPVIFPEYSNTERNAVVFQKGLVLNRIKVKSQTLIVNP